MLMTKAQLQSRLAQIQQQIACARQRHEATQSVILLAVSKRQPVEAIAALAEAGQCAFGESYLQEATEKQQALAGLALEWHFIGPIQSNKTRAIAEQFSWVHSVDRLKIAERLSEQRPADLPPLNLCLQVNISGEATKSGCDPAAVAELVAAIGALPRLRLRGLMAIPAPALEFEQQRQPFAALRQLQQSLVGPFDTLSMGMSDDLEAAIAEGSTLVRVGTALFGAR